MSPSDQERLSTPITWFQPCRATDLQAQILAGCTDNLLVLNAFSLVQALNDQLKLIFTTPTSARDPQVGT